MFVEQLGVSEAAWDRVDFQSPDQLIFEDGCWRVEAGNTLSNIYFSPPNTPPITHLQLQTPNLFSPSPPQFQTPNLAICCVCLEALREVVVFPCLHLATCRQCHDRLERRCCICRGVVLDFLCVVFA